jgi:hypothetical protein
MAVYVDINGLKLAPIYCGDGPIVRTVDNVTIYATEEDDVAILADGNELKRIILLCTNIRTIEPGIVHTMRWGGEDARFIFNNLIM